jgi:UMF1 family MFS transporter
LDSASTATAKQYSRREQRSWYVYDWANSAFASTVLTLFLGPYLTSLARAAAGPDGYIDFAGIAIEPRSWWGYMVSLSVVLQVLVLPVVGTMADRSARKKRLLGLFAYLGAGATMAMYTLDGAEYLQGGVLFVVANVAFGAAFVVYNSFLPEIAPPEESDAVSSRGWGIGYLGGGIVLAINLLLFTQAASLGISEALAVRLCLASAGLWWAAFTVIPMLGLRDRPPLVKGGSGGIAASFVQFARTLAGMRRYPQTLRFLIAYLLYNDAVQAVIALSGQFGADELGIPMATLTLAILMVQFVAFLGAFAFKYISAATGTKPAILLSLTIWIGVLVAIFVSVRTTTGFFIMAAVVALVLGGTQALSRGLFSRLIPPGREAEYFSLYEISDKGTSWLAPLFFGLTMQFTGNYRVAILSLLMFFIAGFAVLVAVDPKRGERDAAAVSH